MNESTDSSPQSTTSTSVAKPFEPSLSRRHAEEISKRGLSPEFCEKSGVSSIADNEARSLGFESVLPHDQRREGLQGILFRYRGMNGKPPIPRLRPDRAPLIDGKPAKYLSRKGEGTHPFYPHTTLPEHQTNSSFNVFLTEGEFKALSLAQHLDQIVSRKTAVIGLQGVNGGWTRDKTVVTKADGTKETKRSGAVHLTEGLQCWQWKNRTVYIIFDSDVGAARHASEFKKNQSAGAWGAEATLAKLLRAAGADVRIVEIPHPLDGGKLGIDDYIQRFGPHNALSLIYNNWVVHRDVEKALYSQNPGTISFEDAQALVESSPGRPDFVIPGILPVEGFAVLAGSPGLGKSGLALALCHAVAIGGKWLGKEVVRGKALYIQAEMPRWSLADRVKALGTLSRDLLMWTPTKLYLNLWEPDGFNKRRDTGTREQISRLAESCHKQAVKLIVFDPLGNFLSVSERDEEAMKSVFETCRELARYAHLGILFVHHHRKIGRSDSKYEGAEDMSGTNVLFRAPDAVMSIYSYERSDTTIRYKLRFSKVRHCEEIPPLELFRGQGSPLDWRCSVWTDSREPAVDRIESIVKVLADSGDDGMKVKELTHATNISRTVIYEQLSALMKTGEIRKEGNVYYLGPRATSTSEGRQRLADDDS